MQKAKLMSEYAGAVEEFEHFLRSYHASAGDVKCWNLIAEALGEAYQARAGSREFRCYFSRKRDMLRVTLIFDGEKYDAIEDERNGVLRRAVAQAARTFSTVYKNGRNIVRFEFSAGRSLKQNLMFLGKFVKRQRLRVVRACLLQLIGIVLSVILPVVTARLISEMALNNIGKIIAVVIVLFVLRVVNDVVVYLANRIHNVAYTRIRYSIEKELADEIMRMQNETIEKHGTGMVIQRMTGDTVALARGVETLVNRSFTFIKYIGVLAAICIMCPTVFAVKLVSIVLLILIQNLKSRRQLHNERAYRIQNDRFSDAVGEMVHGNRDIKLLNSEKPFVENLQNEIKKTTRRHLRLWNTSQNYTVVANETSNIMEFCFYLVITAYLAAGHLSPTDAIVLFNYSLTLVGASSFVGEFLDYIKGMALSGERVYQLMNDREFPKEEFGTEHLDNVAGKIEFRDVKFAYEVDDPTVEPRYVLDGMNFTINAGETVAFVGKSGCGKTTALNLISRLITPTEGHVLLDGVDMASLDKDTVRGNISVVSQNPYVFNMSIRDNLRLIKPDLTEEEMIAICKDVCIHDDIMQLVNGYDTVIGEGGVMISGGQRQRLALARNLLREYRVVLLDEATSALDNLTQAHVQQTINRFKREKTVIIVAHRLSTIKVCDRIFYVSDGRILAEGTHEELMQSCPEYRELYLSE